MLLVTELDQFFFLVVGQPGRTDDRSHPVLDGELDVFVNGVRQGEVNPDIRNVGLNIGQLVVDLYR